MLIALYIVCTHELPRLQIYGLELMDSIMPVVIMIAGIIMLFGAVGIRISNNLGSTIIGAFFRAIGYLCRTIIQAIGWIIRNTFRLLPRIHNESRRIFKQMGVKPHLEVLLSLVVDLVFIAIII